MKVAFPKQNLANEGVVKVVVVIVVVGIVGIVVGRPGNVNIIVGKIVFFG